MSKKINLPPPKFPVSAKAASLPAAPTKVAVAAPAKQAGKASASAFDEGAAPKGAPGYELRGHSVGSAVRAVFDTREVLGEAGPVLDLGLVDPVSFEMYRKTLPTVTAAEWKELLAPVHQNLAELAAQGAAPGRSPSRQAGRSLGQELMTSLGVALGGKAGPNDPAPSALRPLTIAGVVASVGRMLSAHSAQPGPTKSSGLLDGGFVAALGARALGFLKQSNPIGKNDRAMAKAGLEVDADARQSKAAENVGRFFEQRRWAGLTSGFPVPPKLGS